MNAAFVPAHFQNAASGRCTKQFPFTGSIESDYFREVKENDQIRKSLENESAARIVRKGSAKTRPA
jgi:hypothetical protein